MLDLALNCTIRIDDDELNGVFRVVANDGSYLTVVLAKLKNADVANSSSNLEKCLHFADRELIEHLQQIGKIQSRTRKFAQGIKWNS